MRYSLLDYINRVPQRQMLDNFNYEFRGNTNPKRSAQTYSYLSGYSGCFQSRFIFDPHLCPLEQARLNLVVHNLGMGSFIQMADIAVEDKNLSYRVYAYAQASPFDDSVVYYPFQISYNN